jgi:thiamine kinase
MLNLQHVIFSVPSLASARAQRKLAGGPTSDSWLLNLDGTRVVLRVDKPLARTMCLDRALELDILERVAQAGFGPALIWADPAKGLLVTDYICGIHWRVSDACVPENIERLAIRLRELHSASIAGPVLEIAESARRYASITDSVQSRELHGQVTAMLKILRSDLTECVLCHNDLGHRNIVDTGTIMLVDWEYSAAGDPWFDLAGVVRQNGFTATQSRRLLHTYCGGFDKQLERRLSLFSRLYDLNSALWYLVVCAADASDMTNRKQLDAIMARLNNNRA